MCHALVCNQQPNRSGSALVLYPKERPLWITGAHRGARGTLDELKATWGERLAHDGGSPKILWGNLVPAAIADRRIGLQSCASWGRGWLVCNLAYITDRHRVLQEVDARSMKAGACGVSYHTGCDRGRATPVCWCLCAQVCYPNYRLLSSPQMAISIQPLGTHNLIFTCENAWAYLQIRST